MIISLWSVLWYRVWNLGRFNSGFTVVTAWLSPCTGQSVLWKMAPSFIENIVKVFACTMRESESFYRSTKAFSFRWQASAQYYRWRLSAEGDHTSNSCRSQSSTMAWFFYWNSSESTLFTHTFYYWSEWMDGWILFNTQPDTFSQWALVLQDGGQKCIPSDDFECEEVSSSDQNFKNDGWSNGWRGLHLPHHLDQLMWCSGCLYDADVHHQIRRWDEKWTDDFYQRQTA